MQEPVVNVNYAFCNNDGVAMLAAFHQKDGLAGDAAMVGDPLWGTGCGWAFQTAEWLCDAIAGPLKTGDNNDVDAGARRYQRKHRRKLLPHRVTNIDFSQKAGLNPLQRTLYGAGPRDQSIADRFIAVATRNSSPLTRFDPIPLTRAAFAQRKRAIPV